MGSRAILTLQFLVIRYDDPIPTTSPFD